MNARKSKTAKRREQAASLVSQRTVTLTLALDDGQFSLLTRVAEQYNRLWGALVSWCSQNHTVTRARIQKENYRRLREQFPMLPSQFVCIAMRDAAGAVRSWNSNNPKRRWNLKATRKALVINYDQRTMSVRGNMLTLSAMRGERRIRTLVPETPGWFAERYPVRKLGAAKLLIDLRARTAQIALIYRVEGESPVADGDVLGVDLGQHSLYVDSRGGETTSSKIREAKRKYAHNRKTLQEKGTRSAHRRLKAMSGREKRFIRDVNHCVSKQLANSPNVQAIAFEDLTHIRRQAAKCSKTSKRRRNMLHQWSFSQLQEFTTYKAAANGIRIVMVDPSYTSQQCNRCGYVDAGNRNRARFDCKRCAWSDNADHNAAMNIRDRAIATLEHENTSTDRPVDRVQSTTRMDGTPTMTSTSDDDGRVVGDHVHVQTAGLAPEVVDVA